MVVGQATHIFLLGNASEKLARPYDGRNPLLDVPPSDTGVATQLSNANNCRAQSCVLRHTSEQLFSNPLAFTIAETNREFGAEIKRFRDKPSG